MTYTFTSQNFALLVVLPHYVMAVQAFYQAGLFRQLFQ